ncbi:MAG: flagellar assembly protein FliW [Gemmatimonadota bacterium]
MSLVTPVDPQAEVADLQMISSNVLGDVIMPLHARMRLTTPLFGLPDHPEYALLPAARAGLWWLQAMNDPGIAFILADPFVLDPDYVIDLGDVERDSLGITEEADAFALVMLTLPATDSDAVTANFRAPLVFNLREQRGLQIVARNDTYTLRTPVELSSLPPQPDGVRMQ